MYERNDPKWYFSPLGFLMCFRRSDLTCYYTCSSFCCESIKRNDQNAHQRGLVKVVNRFVLTMRHHETEKKEVALQDLSEMKRCAGFNVGLKHKTSCTMIPVEWFPKHMSICTWLYRHNKSLELQAVCSKLLASGYLWDGGG